jgi:protein-arginine deiminase
MPNGKDTLEEAKSDNDANFSSTASVSSGTACKESPPVALYMYLNADRNGTLTRDGLDEWTWGSDGRGTILVANERNSADDRATETLAIRLDPPTYSGALKLAGTLATATEEDSSRIRVLDQHAAVVLGGKTKSATFDIPLAGLQLAIEAAHFDRSPSEDTITLIFTPSVNGVVGDPQMATLRVAPWILPSHLDQAHGVFCSTLAKNEKFRENLAKVIDPLPLIHTPFKIEGKDAPPFTQDSMKIGHSYGSDGAAHQAVLRSPASRWNEVFVSGRLENMPVFEVCEPVEKNNAMDGGNLDVTPPTKTYPLGRIYYSPVAGSKFKVDRALADFLAAQRVQPPFPLDSSWLHVGHVDEMVSFLPTENGLVACVPSPRIALELLLGAAEVEPDATMLRGRKIMFDESLKSGESEVGEFLLDRCFSAGYYRDNFGSEPLQVETISELRFEGLSGGFMGRVLNAVASIREALGKEVSFLEIPVLFSLHHGAAAALTGNMVNMLVLRPGACVMQPPAGPILSKTFIIEKPESFASDFIPIPAMKVPQKQDLFQSYTQQALAAIGWQCAFVDGWDVYHLKHGETHCATQTRRIASTSPQWWSVDPSNYPVQPTSRSGKKGKEERSWSVVRVPKNNDCFFHAVLFAASPDTYLDMPAVKKLRTEISDQILSTLARADLVGIIEKGLEKSQDYITLTETFLFNATLPIVERYNTATTGRADDFLGQNIADALFRMRYTNEEIENNDIPMGMKKGTIWGDSDFVAPEVADFYSRPLYFYENEEQPTCCLKVGEEDYDGEPPIRLLISDDSTHFDAIEGDPEAEGGSSGGGEGSAPGVYNSSQDSSSVPAASASKGRADEEEDLSDLDR